MQTTPVKRKKAKMKKSAPVMLWWLLARYCRIYHSPRRKATAGIR
jgi:hypothetical protein